MDKIELKTLKPGDKFTVEFTVGAVCTGCVYTTSHNTVYFTDTVHSSYINYELLGVTKQPLRPNPGDTVRYRDGAEYKCINLIKADNGNYYLIYENHTGVYSCHYIPDRWEVVQ